MSTAARSQARAAGLATDRRPPLARRTAKREAVMVYPSCLRCTKALVALPSLVCEPRENHACTRCSTIRKPCLPVPPAFIPKVNRLHRLRAAAAAAATPAERAVAVNHVTQNAKAFSSAVEAAILKEERQGLTHRPQTEVEVGLLLIGALKDIARELQVLGDLARYYMRLPPVDAPPSDNDASSFTASDEDISIEEPVANVSIRVPRRRLSEAEPPEDAPSKRRRGARGGVISTIVAPAVIGPPNRRNRATAVVSSAAPVSPFAPAGPSASVSSSVSMGKRTRYSRVLGLNPAVASPARIASTVATPLPAPSPLASRRVIIRRRRPVQPVVKEEEEEEEEDEVEFLYEDEIKYTDDA